MVSYCHIITLFLLFISLNAMPLASYEENQAKRYVDYAGVSYCCPGAKCTQWTCNACKKYPGMVNVTGLHNETSNANGFVGVNPSGDGISAGFIMVVFTGTNPLSVKNWIDDIDTIYTRYPACSGCEVHEGFYKTYLSVRDDLHKPFSQLLTAYPHFEVQVTGHSLGAAMAVHAALDLMQTYSIQISPMYTFGQPRVGNTAFEQYYYQALSQNVFRVTHWMDPVPHLPPVLFGFTQNPKEVFYAANSESYTICNIGEDPLCSDRFLIDFNVIDHLNYIGFDFVTNFLSCEL